MNYDDWTKERRVTANVILTYLMYAYVLLDEIVLFLFVDFLDLMSVSVDLIETRITNEQAH